VLGESRYQATYMPIPCNYDYAKALGKQHLDDGEHIHHEDVASEKNRLEKFVLSHDD